MRALTTSLLAVGVTLAACDDVPSPVAPVDPGAAPLFNSGATITEGDFFATAACSADIGFDIHFGGHRVLVRHVSGNDETFSFRTQDFRGWRMPETTFNDETVDFDVVGGAEMFNIKRNEDDSFHVRIHQGTLVFQALEGDDRVLARHVIRHNPGHGEMVSEWSCKLQ